MSTRWICETRKAFRGILYETNFPDTERKEVGNWGLTIPTVGYFYLYIFLLVMVKFPIFSIKKRITDRLLFR